MKDLIYGESMKPRRCVTGWARPGLDWREDGSNLAGGERMEHGLVYLKC